MKRWLECPACHGVFRVVAAEAILQAGMPMHIGHYTDRNGELCGESYGSAADIPCLDCLATAREIRLATGDYPFSSRWIRKGDPPERAHHGD